MAEGGSVTFLERERNQGGNRYIVDGMSSSQLQSWIDELALRLERTSERGEMSINSRIALYRPTSPSMDEGWTRWLLERYEFSFSNIGNAEIVDGNLNDRYDVILIPDIRSGSILNGFAEGSVPRRFAGGIGDRGVRRLERFITSGGTLVTFNQSSLFAIDQFHLPVENIVAGLERDEFFVSGSILEVEINTDHQVMTGMPERAGIFVDRSPVFDTLETFQGSVLATYGEHGSPLLSGYLLGEEHLQGHAAALDVSHGEGRVILIGFRPQWRGQPFGTFRILFNAALSGVRQPIDGQ
jgi:hypothetical protein